MNERFPKRMCRVSTFVLLGALGWTVLASAATAPAPPAKPPAPATAPPPAAPTPPAAPDPSQAWGIGVAAYERGDYPAYLAAFESLYKVAPDHPMIMMRLASAYALSGRLADAIRTLSRLADLGICTEIAPDNDFRSLATAPDAAGLRLRLQALHEKHVQTSVIAFRL